MKETSLEVICDFNSKSQKSCNFMTCICIFKKGKKIVASSCLVNFRSFSVMLVLVCEVFRLLVECHPIHGHKYSICDMNCY